jgi:uracil-DNA glycosylase
VQTRIKNRSPATRAVRARPDGDEHGTPDVPETPKLHVIRAAAAKCKACPLYRNATQTVFGEGSDTARVLLLGEQPGDQEDVEGRPFVGPAGRLLDRALEEAGLPRDDCYVTNVVKHFKWEPRGKRRIHKKPSARDIASCRPWLEAELSLIRPAVVVCLGATATQFVFGRDARIEPLRGRVVRSGVCPATVVTVHPSSLLRQPDEESRKREFERFVSDLRVATKRAGSKVSGAAAA